MGLVYCDFKPDNVMLEKDDVKLIDMGGVRRIDDQQGDIYGTTGYSAPEAGEGPTPFSDLYTVGRTLAVLLTDIHSFTSDHRYSLPAPQEEPLFAQHESLYRCLLKATAEKDRRSLRIRRRDDRATAWGAAGSGRAGNQHTASSDQRLFRRGSAGVRIGRRHGTC